MASTLNFTGNIEIIVTPNHISVIIIAVVVVVVCWSKCNSRAAQNTCQCSQCGHAADPWRRCWPPWRCWRRRPSASFPLPYGRLSEPPPHGVLALPFYRAATCADDDEAEKGHWKTILCIQTKTQIWAKENNYKLRSTYIYYYNGVRFLCIILLWIYFYFYCAVQKKSIRPLLKFVLS